MLNSPHKPRYKIEYMKREETINKYLEKYLEGKSEQQRAEFMAKDTNKQYSAIMAWKRRSSLKKAVEGITAAEVLKHIKTLPTLISMVDILSAQQIQTLLGELDKVRAKLENYEADRARREIEELEKRKQELDRKIARLRDITGE